MDIYVPYTDISEFGQLGANSLPGEERYTYSNRSLDEALKLAEKAIKTPLAFAHLPANSSETKNRLLKHGWKDAGSILNWHQAHGGDHSMTIYYKRFDNPPLAKSPGSPYRKSMYPCHHSFVYGCGGRITELDKLIDHGIGYGWHRFLTLLRLPKEDKISASTRKWLEAMHFRVIPGMETEVAEYMMNGWDTEEWTESFEMAFWGKFKAPEKPAKL